MASKNCTTNHTPQNKPVNGISKKNSSGLSTPGHATPSSSKCNIDVSIVASGSENTEHKTDVKTPLPQNTSSDRASHEKCESLVSASLHSSCSPARVSSGSSHGCNVSPVSFSNGKESTVVSADDSIFTYSFTDESQDEADGKGGKNMTASDSMSPEKSVDSNETGNNFIDKSAVIKDVIEKDYTFTITYTIEDLIRFQQEDSFFAKHDMSGNGEKSENFVKAGADLSYGDLKETSHKKFPGRSFKNFIKSMSPGGQHRKLSKGSGSLGSRSSSTLAGSVDSIGIGEEPHETVCTEEVAQKISATKKSPVAGKKSPMVGKKSPVAGKKSPVAGKKSPHFGHIPHEQKHKKLTHDSGKNNGKFDDHRSPSTKHR